MLQPVLVLQVSAAASVVSQALGDLLQHVRQYTARGEPIGRYDQATDTIMTVTESIFCSMGDAGKSEAALNLRDDERGVLMGSSCGVQGQSSPVLCETAVVTGGGTPESVGCRRI